MRRLLLLRHAKSSWAEPDRHDHDRPLNPRGRRAADAIGRHLREQGPLPDLVLCSSARRSCETAARLDLPPHTVIDVEHDLYLARPETVLERVRAVDDAVTTVMVIGHNPTTHDLALELAGTGNSDAIARLGQKYPTGALAVLDVGGRWSDLGPGRARLTAFVTPRDLE